MSTARHLAQVSLYDEPMCFQEAPPFDERYTPYPIAKICPLGCTSIALTVPRKEESEATESCGLGVGPCGARKEIEAFIDRKVFLSLTVKVEKNWRENAQSLKRYGYPANTDP